MILPGELTRLRLIGSVLGVAWGRLLDMPNRPGQWGKFLASIVTCAWAIGFLTEAPAMQERVPTLLSLGGGYLSLACWLFFVAGFPIIAVAMNSPTMRILSTTAMGGTWIAVLLDALFHWTGYRTAFGSVLVGILGCLNADVRLIRDLVRRRALRVH